MHAGQARRDGDRVDGLIAGHDRTLPVFCSAFRLSGDLLLAVRSIAGADLDPARLRAGTLRQGQRQHSILEIGRCMIDIDVARQRDLASDLSGTELMHVPAPAVLRLDGPARCAQGQNALLIVDVELVWSDTWNM